MKVWDWPGSNLGPLDLQSDSHLLPDMLPTALHGLVFYPVDLQHSRCKHTFSVRVENSVDPDQLASSEAT